MSKEFDFNKYQKRKIDNWTYQTQLIALEEQRLKLHQEITAYNETCTHDLVINFGKEGPYEPDTGYSLCICCGKAFKLKEDAEDVRPEAVIDIVGKVPEKYFYTYCGREKILMTRIKVKMNFVVQEADSMPMDELKQILIEDLIIFTGQHQKENKERLVRVRETKKVAKYED